MPRLEADPYYRYVTFALVPLLWAAFVYGAWFCMRTPLTWAGQLAIVMSTGMVGGFCINLGHELGHKKTRLERWLAKIVLAPTFYGHFTIDNSGHWTYTLDNTNPTVDAFARSVAALEGANLSRWPAAQAFASGMAAISGVFFAFARAGAHVVASAAVYGGTYSLLRNVLTRFP